MIVGSIIRLPISFFGPKSHFGLVVGIDKEKKLVEVCYNGLQGTIPEDQTEIGRFILGRKYRFLPTSPQFQEVRLKLFKSGYETDLNNSFGTKIDIKITDDCYSNIDIKKEAFKKLEEFYYEYID